MRMRFKLKVNRFYPDVEGMTMLNMHIFDSLMGDVEGMTTLNMLSDLALEWRWIACAIWIRGEP